MTSSRWEALREQVKPPRSITELMAKPEGGPAWWLPSLVYLAYRTVESTEARRVLDELASRRDELGYAVVEEQTDDVVGFTVQPWPLVDERGRLRFPIDRDPLEIEVPAEGLAELLGDHRERWHRIGLMASELVNRRVHIGDVFAVHLADRPHATRLEALPHGDQPARYLGGLPDRGEDSASVPIVDITWDAREAGKLAHYAAAGGIIPDEPGAAAAAFVEETEARYLIGLRDGKDPRDVPTPRGDAS
jgi:hypothetical protein